MASIARILYGVLSVAIVAALVLMLTFGERPAPQTAEQSVQAFTADVLPVQE
jgi:hypothetical protein